ncbi:MAG: zinc-ribbon domain-containing protein [Gemmatimonadetes bacterium]|nr:zinc-ribbon domain-containing protein [Gemmatimonadota bacterium]
MNVTCPSCTTVYRVDPAKVPEAGVRARCKVCQGIFPVTRAMGASVGAAPAAPAAARVPEAPAAAAPVVPPPRPPRRSRSPRRWPRLPRQRPRRPRSHRPSSVLRRWPLRRRPRFGPRLRFLRSRPPGPRWLPRPFPGRPVGRPCLGASRPAAPPRLGRRPRRRGRR